MTINILTIFPEFFEKSLNTSILKRAQEKNLVKFNVVNIRDFATDKHRTTDDRPFGGEPGMVMKIEPIYRALQLINQSTNKLINQSTILTSAKGKLFDQPKAIDYAKLDNLTIICGHYEGVDERIAENLVDEEIRIGDYVLSGGEAAALVVSDAVTRLIPGVLGNEESNQEESHSAEIKFSHPVYTRPEKFLDWIVPQVLLSGDHAKIKAWQAQHRS